MGQIAISKNGIKTSILTYVSSYSIGAIMIIASIIYYSYNTCSLHFNPLLLFSSMSIEMRVFFLLMIFIVAYPIGLLFAWVSWAFLGWMEKYLETFHFEYKTIDFFVNGSKNYFCFEMLVKYYDLKKDNFYSICRMKEVYLQKKRPKLYHSLDDTLGISNLIRHLTLLSFIISGYYLIQFQFLSAIVSILSCMLLIIINSAVCFHYSLAILLLGLKEKEKANYKEPQVIQESELNESN
jgi:hypothetical protein